jgi:PE family
MPFDWSDATNTGPNTSTLRVEPDQVLQLKAELQLIYNEVEEFLETKAQAMTMRPLGADLVSLEAAQAFNENSQSAIDAALGYLDEVKRVLDALDQAAKTYNLVEDANTQTFRQGAR